MRGENGPEMHADTGIPNANKAPKRHCSVRLRTIADLDGCTRARREATDLLRALDVHLGGEATVVEREIAEGAAMLRQFRRHVWTCFLTGEAVEPEVIGAITTLVSVCNTERRQYESLGTERRAKDVTPDLRSIEAEYAAKALSEPQRSPPMRSNGEAAKPPAASDETPISEAASHERGASE